MILVFQREREGGIVVKILEILNGKVIHLEHQRRRIMHLEEDQPAVHRPRPFKHSGRPIKCSRTMHPEEDHERPMHPEEGEPGVRVYGENCASIVGIYRVTIFDRSAYDAIVVVGFYKNKDVAVLRVEKLEGKVKSISIGPFANLLVGQKVFAIGSLVSIQFGQGFPPNMFGGTATNRDTCQA